MTDDPTTPPALRGFECRREIDLPADPERVWAAIATPEGLEAWQFPAMADLTEVATAWEPPLHLAIRQEEGDWFNALEYHVEGVSGGRSRMRYVHSGVFVSDWDHQFDAVSQHTDFYLHTLGQYLAHFDGRRATYIGDMPGGIQGPARSMEPDGFTRLCAALGLATDAVQGQQVLLATDGPAAIEGVVDYLHPNFLGVRTATALYRFFGRNAFGGPVGMQIHVFEPVADPDATKAAWQAWLDRVLA